MFIYKITNVVNNKIYIGCTTKTLEERFKKHILDSKKRKWCLQCSMLKYGVENFSIEPLEEVDTIEEMFEVEKFYIKELKINIKKYPDGNGMNMTDGGDGCLGPKSPRTQEHKDNLRKVNLGKKLTEEHKEKLRQAHIGRKWSDERKKNYSKAKLGKGVIPVSQFTLDGTFIRTYTSGTEAQQITGISKCHISSVCRGKRKTTGGFIWKYA